MTSTTATPSNDGHDRPADSDAYFTLEALGMSLTFDQREQYEREALAYLRGNPDAPDADLLAIMERVQAG